MNKAPYETKSSTVAKELAHSNAEYKIYSTVSASLVKRTNEMSVAFDQISIKDMSVLGQKEMTRILNQIDLCIKHDKPVYVHWYGGRGRTGTVVGCYLARRGIATGQKAIEKIKDLRRDTPDSALPSPETREQAEMVVNWEEGL